MTSFSPSGQRLARAVAVLLMCGVGLAGCQSDPAPDSYVARVGSHYLTEAELDRMLPGPLPGRDTSKARQQAIDQWVTRTLLYREAERLNLESTDEVQRELERQRRSILVAALRDRYEQETDVEPTPEEVRTYFERHKEQLRLREPYVRVQYLATSRPAAAQTVRQALGDSSPADTTWTRLVAEYAADTTRARRLSQRVLPERQLDQQLPFLAERLDALTEGETAPVVEANGQYHVLRLDRRVSEGASPDLEWVAPQIRRRLRIRARKQMYATEVQRLRSRAQADGALELP